jgi:CheY-like chemotaxis protein
MATPRLLLSGDYWHADFRDLVAGLSVPATLTPLEKIEAMDTQRFSLIVIAQSRSNQFDQAAIDSIVARNPLTPVVMLLGSWCEGERRSDTPVAAVKRVFWHQWSGRFDDFTTAMNEQGISLWHSPPIETDADRIKAVQTDRPLTNQPVIGISALNQPTFETLSEAITSIGGRPKWVERTSQINLSASATLICIDADSADQALERRIQWVQKQLAHVPLIVLMNFPRRQETERLNQLGVTTVISKPFELAQLQTAIESTIGQQIPPAPVLRGPSFSRSRPTTKTAK